MNEKVTSIRHSADNLLQEPRLAIWAAIIGSSIIALAVIKTHLLFTLGLAGGLIFVVIIAQRIEVLIIFLIFIIPFQSQLPQRLNIGGGINAFNILVALLLLLWFLHKVDGRLVQIKKNPMTWVFLAFYLMIFLGIIRSIHWMGWGIVSQSINPAKRWILPTFLFFPIAVSNFDEKKLKLLIWAIAGVVFLMAFQSLRDFHSVGFGHYSDYARLGGPFGIGGENDLAAFFVYYFPLVAAAAFFDKKIINKFFFYGVVLISIVTILFTYSRGAYLGGAAALLFLGITKKRGLLFVGIILAISYRLWIPAAVTERVEMTEKHMIVEEAGEIIVSPSAIENNFEKSTALRITIWKGALKMIQEYPIRGFGFQMFEPFMTNYAQIAYHMDTHNMYLRTAVEHGLPGLGIFLLLWIVPFIAALKLYRIGNLPLTKAVSLGLIAGIVGIAIVNLWGSRFFRDELVGLYWIVLGILYRLKTIEEERRSQKKNRTTFKANFINEGEVAHV